MDGAHFLHGLPVELIKAAYSAAPGNEIESGKFASPESSAALVANAFGLFLNQPQLLPALSSTDQLGWPAASVNLEATVRFPWSGGRHPCLDVLIATDTALIGVESKRYEPFRPRSKIDLSKAYWRPVWGDSMQGYERVRDDLSDGSLKFVHLDAVQLVKHAFGLRTAVHRNRRNRRFVDRQAVLFYLYAEPACWSNGRVIPVLDFETHRTEIAAFANAVSNDEVQFISASYCELLAGWSKSPVEIVRVYAAAIAARFRP